MQALEDEVVKKAWELSKAYKARTYTGDVWIDADEIDRTGTYQPDGHASAKVMVRHVAKLSGAEAAARTVA